MSKSRTVYHQRLRQISTLLRQTPPTSPAEDMKTCHQCGQQYPREIQYWCKRYKRGKIYMTSPCRACYSLARKLKRQPPRKPAQITAAKQRRQERNQQLQAQRIAAAERNRQIVEEFRKSIE